MLDRELVLVEADDQFSAETAATNYRTLVDDEQVLALVNMGGSHISSALMPDVERDEITLVGPPGTFPAQKANPYVFNSNVDTNGTAAVAVARLAELVGSPDDLVVMVAHLNIPSGEEWNTFIQEQLTAQGGTFAGAIAMDPAALDAPAVVININAAIREQGVNAIALQGAPAQVLAIASEMASQGLTDIPIVGIQGLAAPSVYTEGPEAMWDSIEGIHSFMPMNVSTPGTDEMRGFLEGKEEYAGFTGLPYFTNGWLAGMFVEQASLRAAREAGELTRQTFHEAMQGEFDVKGLTCPTDFTDTNYVPCAVPFEWDGEALVPVGSFEDWSDVVEDSTS